MTACSGACWRQCWSDAGSVSLSSIPIGSSSDPNTNAVQPRIALAIAEVAEQVSRGVALRTFAPSREKPPAVLGMGRGGQAVSVRDNRRSAPCKLLVGARRNTRRDRLSCKAPFCDGHHGGGSPRPLRSHYRRCSPAFPSIASE